MHCPGGECFAPLLNLQHGVPQVFCTNGVFKCHVLMLHKFKRNKILKEPYSGIEGRGAKHSPPGDIIGKSKGPPASGPDPSEIHI